MSVILPARDKHLVFQPASRFSMRSRMYWNRALETLSLIVGTPKYLPRSSVHSISKILQIASALWPKVLGENKIFDLGVLSLFPDVLQNRCRHHLMILACSSVASGNKIMSSAKHRCENSGPPRPATNDFHCLLATRPSMSYDSLSMHATNK